MIRLFRDMPIKGKLMTIILGISSAVMVVAVLALTSYSAWTNWNHGMQDITTLAKVAGLNTAAALMFDDPRAASETLASLGADPGIIAAYLLTDDRKVFAQYRAPGEPALDDASLSRSIDAWTRQAASASLWRLEGELVAVAPIVRDDHKLGLVLIRASAREVIDKIYVSAYIALAIAAGVLLIVFRVSSRLQRTISSPILSLTDTMRHVSESRNYQVQVEKPSNDEIGTLYDGFNAMLDTIQARTRELRDSEERFRALVETTNDWIWETDENARYTYASPRVRDLLGYQPQEVVGRTPFDLMPPAEAERVAAEFGARVRAHAPLSGLENVNLHKDGHLVALETNGVPVFDAEGRFRGYRGIDRDITERKQAESALREKSLQLEAINRTLEQRVEEEVAIRARNEQILQQQSKLAAMGEMLGAIAHQWRQPLNALGLIIQNLRDAQAFGELNKEYVEQSVQKSMAQIQHMSATIENFRNFFRPDRDRTRFDAMRAVGDVLSLFSAQLSSNSISYRLTCHTHGRTFEDHAHLMLCPEKTIEGYHNEFEHVILNLIDNGRHAILEKRERDPQFRGEQGRLTFDFTLEAGKVIVEVGDNGGGIPGETIGRIFEPYFTTKDAAKGTGLGLYMSKVIIEDHMQGKLSARNSGQGAVFRIELPHAAGGGSHG